MKKNKIIYMLFLILLAFSSCTKERGTFTQVKGKVLEHGSDIPVENALVKFVRLNRYPLNTIETILDTCRTSLEGEYHFDVHTDADDFDLLVYAETEQHFNHNMTSSVSRPKHNVKRGINQFVEINIIPFAWVRVKAVKTIGNDYAWINRVIGSKSVFGFEITEGIEKTRRTLGNSEVSINSFLMRNNLQNGTKSYQIQSTAGDTTEIIIYY